MQELSLVLDDVIEGSETSRVLGLLCTEGDWILKQMTLPILLADVEDVGDEGDREIEAIFFLLNDREHAVKPHEAVV